MTPAIQTSRDVQTRPAPILLLAETGLIIRNILLGTFGRAVARERPLVVAVSRPDDSRLGAVVEDLGDVKLISFPRRPRFLPEDRLGRLLAWESYLPRFITAGKANVSAEYLRRNSDSGHSVAGQLYVDTIYGVGRAVHKLGLQPRLEARYFRSLAKHPIVDEWRQVLARHRPAAVLSMALSLAKLNSHSHDLPAMLAAGEAGVPRGTLVQSWDNLTSKPAIFPADLDRYWTWSADMTRELLRLYPHVPAERVVEVGGPQLDFHDMYRTAGGIDGRETFCRALGFDPERPIVLIGTGTPSRLPHEHRAVLDLVERLGQVAPRVQCLIRLHPKDDGGRWRDLESTVEALGARLQYNTTDKHMDYGGFVPPKEFFRDQATTLLHAAVVVNAASTLTVDCAILDRPSICLAYDLTSDEVFPEGRHLAFSRSSHYAKLVETGGVKVVYSPEDACRAIIERLDDPSLESEGRKAIVRKVTDRVDGGAGERLAEEVLRLASNG